MVEEVKSFPFLAHSKIEQDKFVGFIHSKVYDLPGGDIIATPMELVEMYCIKFGKDPLFDYLNMDTSDYRESNKSAKFYVVWRGHRPGIYDSFAAASIQVDGVYNRQWKAIIGYDEAIRAIRTDYWEYLRLNGRIKDADPRRKKRTITKPNEADLQIEFDQLWKKTQEALKDAKAAIGSTKEAQRYKTIRGDFYRVRKALRKLRGESGPIDNKTNQTKRTQAKGNKSVKKHFYAVKIGRVAGIYETWAECKGQVNGFKRSKFKGFATLPEAEKYMTGGH